MKHKWEIQVCCQNWWISFGFHVDHKDPSITFHLPGFIVYMGNCKQPGFKKTIKAGTMRKLDSPTIHVSLSSTCEADCECGEPYSAIVMAWSEPSKEWPKGTWYNSGIVCRATSPEKAFAEALQVYKTWEKE